MSKYSNIFTILKTVITKLNTTKWFYAFVIVVYSFFILFYMGPITWNCGDSLSGIGDSTGGPIWRSSMEPEQPLLGGPQKQTNYPFGESLYSPVGYASIAQTLTIRGLDKVVGPVCAYNSFNIISYFATALVMFAFLLYLLKSRWVALLGGYAVSFTPYIQSKIGGHPSYGYAALLIGVFWVTLHIIKRRQYRYGFILASLLALCAYFDPYFILLSVTVMMPTIFAWFITVFYSYIKHRSKTTHFTPTLKVFIVALAAFIVLISPLIYVRINDASSINASTGPTRANVAATAALCSNKPLDYLMPDPYNMHLMSWFGLGYTKANIEHRNWCGPGESRVSISLAAIVTIVVASTTYLFRRRYYASKPAIPNMEYKTELIIVAAVLVILSAFLLGLPPEIRGVITPSGIVIKLTETWRIFAREYLVLNAFVIILFSIAFVYLISLLRARWKKSIPFIFGIIWTIIIAEYQIFTPFSPFNFTYSRDVPQIYRDIKVNKDIKALAEYPIDRMGVESDVIVYYTTMQYVHKKPIVNSALINDPRENFHVSIKDLSDPQTIPALRKIGIKYIIIHGVSPKDILKVTDQLEIVKVETPKVYGIQLLKKAKNNTINLARIKSGTTIDYTAVITNGYTINANIMKSPINTEYEVLQGAKLEAETITKTRLNRIITVCFDIKTAGAPQNVTSLTILVNGKTFSRYNINEQSYTPVNLDINDGDVISLINNGGFNMRLNNLGCK